MRRERLKKILPALLTAACLMTACGEGTEPVQGGDAVTESEGMEQGASDETHSTEAGTEGTEMEPNEDMIAEAIRQETSRVESESETAESGSGAQEETPREPTAEISDLIPPKYTDYQMKEPGRIEQISYTTRDYFGDGEEVTKYANVYLPYDYSEDRQYNVLYLMHGIGGDENEWGMNKNSSKVKLIMDNLIYYGDIEPFIVVTPNGRSSSNFAAQGSDYNSFYVFGQ